MLNTSGLFLCFWHFYYFALLTLVEANRQSYIFSACISAFIVGLLAKWSRRYKIWGVIGVVVHMIGAVLMVRFRKLNNPTYELVLSQVIGGLGGGATTIAAQLGVQSVVGHQGMPYLAPTRDARFLINNGRTDIAMSTAVFLTITQIGEFLAFLETEHVG
jgi:hypothetical protein